MVHFISPAPETYTQGRMNESVKEEYLNHKFTGGTKMSTNSNLEVNLPSKDHKQQNLSIESEFANALFDSILGLESKFIKYDPDSRSLLSTINDPYFLTAPQKAIVDYILTLGTNYRQISEVMISECYMCSQNPIIRLFIDAVNEELRHYARNVISAQDMIALNSAIYITPICVYNYSLEHYKLLQLLINIVKECENKKWNELLSCLYNYVQRGNLKTEPAFQRIVSQVFSFFLKAVHAWISEGALIYEDAFFIRENHDTSDSEIWVNKFSLDYDALPSIIDADVAEKILYLGKACNLILSIDPECSYKSLISPISTGLEDDCITSLENLASTTNKACLIINETLNKVFNREFNILEISNFLKNTILLSSSQFSRSLICDLKPHFLNIPSIIQKNNILFPIELIVTSAVPSNLDSAHASKLSVSVAQRDHECRALMDMILISFSPDFPESIFLTERILEKYMKAFDFIWRIVKLKDALISCTRLRLKLFGLLKNPPHSVEFRHTSTLLHMMRCFLTALIEYINIHCLQSTWNEFKRNIEAAKDFDSQLKAHSDYVNTLETKILFHHEQNNGILLSKIYNIFDTIQSALSFSWTVQLIQTRLLRDDPAYNGCRLEIMKHENLILEEAEFGAVTCGLQLQFNVNSNSEILSIYSKLKQTSTEKIRDLSHFLLSESDYYLEKLLVDLHYAHRISGNIQTILGTQKFATA